MQIKLTRESGRAVKPGRGGWGLFVWWGQPMLQYIDPDTGNAAGRLGWDLRRSWRWCRSQVAMTNERQDRNLDEMEAV